MTTTDVPQAHGVRIEAEPGRARIDIDGQRVDTHVVAYQLEHSVPDQLPTLVLHVRETDPLLWEGFARVAVAHPQPVGDQIADFLAGIDSAALQRAALDRGDLDGGKHGVTEAILRQLQEWARGVDSR